ncbi:MAG: hypothetical protein Q9181_001303 [Wetmoreana brouardii]
MTTAHRPTFDPARGKDAQRGVAYHQRLLPAHTQLKTRKPGQGGDADAQPRDLRAQLLEAEAAHFSKGDGVTAKATSTAEPTTSSKRQLEAGPGQNGDDEEDIETKRRRVLEETRHIDADSDDSSSASSEEDSDEEEDETAELLRELEKIKKERAEKQAEEARNAGYNAGNPLLNPYKDSETKRRWDEDVVFRNQARGTENKGKKEFVNVWTLLTKDLLVAAVRRPATTTTRALLLPLAVVLIVSFTQYYFNPPQHFGVGQPGLVLSLSDAISRSSGGRNTIAFVDNGMTGGDVSAMIDEIGTTFRKAGKSVHTLAQESDLLNICSSSQRGTTGCSGAVVFHSSPSEPAEGGVWNYTIRSDISLGGTFDVTSTNNDAQVYLIPLQRAIDLAITSHMSPATQAALQEVQQYPYTQESEEKRERDTRMSYFSAGVNYFGVVFFLGMVGVVYQMTGLIASEREHGLSQLIDAMMPNTHRWQPQLARLVAHHAAFSIICLPSWLATGIVLATVVFVKSAATITIIYHLTAGLALCSYALVGAAFFRKAQLSGIIMTVIAVVLAVLAQVLAPKPATVLALSLIFPSSNYTYFITLMARWEYADLPTNLSETAPESPWRLHGVVLWIFLVIQIAVYPVLAALVERILWSTASRNRTIHSQGNVTSPTVRLRDFSKTYRQHWFPRTFWKRKADVNAVKDLTLDARRGQILMLLGPNGSGKSTTLDAIAGLSKAKSKTLSGGQKRKLQLAMMFAGGSSVCCVDEVSSGLDLLSRRIIWDILLAERKDRTIIMTTHFLDEADFLSDHIAILSTGHLKAEGSSAGLKHQYGEGYSIHLPLGTATPNIQGIERKESLEGTIYAGLDPMSTAHAVDALERAGVDDFRVSGPTLEDVFLKLAGRPLISDPLEDRLDFRLIREKPKDDNAELVVPPTSISLDSGRSIKCISTRLDAVSKAMDDITSQLRPNADNAYTSTYPSYVESLATNYNPEFVGGPSARITDGSLSRLADIYSPNHTKYGYGPISNGSSLKSVISAANTYEDFDQQIALGNATISPGGFWLGDGSSKPTFAWCADPYDFATSLQLQNILHNMLTNSSITTAFSAFDIPEQPITYDFVVLLFIIYYCLVLCLYPAFYALYPTVERLRHVRALQYSNGVRSLPLWLAYLVFDMGFTLLTSVVSTALLSVGTRLWYHLPYIFLIFFLYGTSSALLSYLVSMFARSQLAAWSLCASAQVLLCLGYFGAYLGVQSNVGIGDLVPTLDKVHFTIGLVSPIANVMRALFVALNQFTLLYGGTSNPGTVELYGGPILYLILQIAVFGMGLLWWDSGVSPFALLQRQKTANRKSAPTFDMDDEAAASSTVSKDVADEVIRVQQSDDRDGLRVLHLSKSFRKHKAVDDVSFRVDKGEVFALLGPNGAGKSTAISLIRGDIPPSTSSTRAEITVNAHSVLTHRATARAHLGVCPQFSAADNLTVHETLTFYARVRGIEHPGHNISTLLSAFSLAPYSHKLTHALSGGTKRKLSIAIAFALIGNPAVLLLDEPSTGLDARAKRELWAVLKMVGRERAVLLTTHSMEEADALGDRAGIMSSRMLTVGTVEKLRKMWGGVLNVHLLMASAPDTGREEVEAVKRWVWERFRGEGMEVEDEDETFGGQVRFRVPAQNTGGGNGGKGGGGIGRLFRMLEEGRRELGVEYFSVWQTRMDEVFSRSGYGDDSGGYGGPRIGDDGYDVKGGLNGGDSYSSSVRNGDDRYGSNDRSGSSTLGSGITGGAGFGNKYDRGTQESTSLGADYGAGYSGGESTDRNEPYSNHREYGSGATGGAGFGNKSSDATPGDASFGGNPEVARNSDPYVGHTEYGSGSTGGAGYGNKTSNRDTRLDESEDPYNGTKGNDSTSGKIMEKVGSMFGNEKMQQKGLDKRERAGYGDNTGPGSYGERDSCCHGVNSADIWRSTRYFLLAHSIRAQSAISKLMIVEPSERANGDIAALLRRFENIIEYKPGDRNAAAVDAYRMEVETAALIRAAEDILSLTRVLKEMWLFGKLQTVGTNEAEERAEKSAMGVEEGLRKLLVAEKS